MINWTAPLAWLRRRYPEEIVRERLLTLRFQWRLILRLALATSIAWGLAHGLVGHAQPFFAPISAVIVTLGGGSNRRLRTMVELVLGVAVGVLIGELSIVVIGRGSWQIAVVVTVAITVGMLAGVGGLATIQAVNSAILIVAILPPDTLQNPALARFIDALLGGSVGLLMLLIIPNNVMRDIDRSVKSMLASLASVLRGVAKALSTKDFRLAQYALDEARAAQSTIDSATTIARRAEETVRFAPARWRQRQALQIYFSAIRDIDNVLRNARVLARRSRAVVRRGNRVPAPLISAISELAEAVEIFSEALAMQKSFKHARAALVSAAHHAHTAINESLTMHSAAIAVQIRSLAADLLFASGVTSNEIDELFDFD